MKLTCSFIWVFVNQFWAMAKTLKIRGNWRRMLCRVDARETFSTERQFLLTDNEKMFEAASPCCVNLSSLKLQLRSLRNPDASICLKIRFLCPLGASHILQISLCTKHYGYVKLIVLHWPNVWKYTLLAINMFMIGLLYPLRYKVVSFTFTP